MSQTKLTVAPRPVRSDERLQTNGSQAELSPQTNLARSAGYFETYLNVLPTLELEFSRKLLHF